MFDIAAGVGDEAPVCGRAKRIAAIEVVAAHPVVREVHVVQRDVVRRDELGAAAGGVLNRAAACPRRPVPVTVNAPAAGSVEDDPVRGAVGRDAPERQPAGADGGVGHVQRRAGRRRDGVHDGRVVLRRRHRAAAGGGEAGLAPVLSARPPVKLMVDPVFAFRKMPWPGVRDRRP